MAIPHRVGGALIVLGQNEGEQERVPGHLLTPPNYGAGNHVYFPSYPLTSPSNVITKVAGTLGATTGPAIDYTPDTLPRNYVNIVAYKTALNHRFTKIAWVREGVYDAYNSDCINDPLSPYFGDENAYANAYSYALRRDIFAKFVDETGVVNILDDPTQTPPSLRTLFPRWTDESPWDMGAKPYEDAMQVFPASDPTEPYWQTRKGPDNQLPASQEPVDFIAPWYVTYNTDLEEPLYQSLTRTFYDFSFKFSSTTYDSTNPVAYELVYPYFNRQESFFWNQQVPDLCTWQYSSGYPTGAYRTVGIEVYPQNDDAQIEPMRWEAEATHGLFVDANGSCWNLGTQLEVKVYIYRAPPKRCFYPRQDSVYGLPSAWTNWISGGTPLGPYTPQYLKQSGVSSWFTGRAYGGPGQRHSIGYPGLSYVETGLTSELPFSIPEPNPMAIMFWGVCFAPDYDSELCVEHDVLTFTVTIDESNTAYCDGTAREGVDYTAFGVKVADIVIPKVEGYITYIQDYEVTEITKPGEV